MNMMMKQGVSDMQTFFSMNEAIDFFSCEHRYIVINRDVNRCWMQHWNHKDMMVLIIKEDNLFNAWFM